MEWDLDDKEKERALRQLKLTDDVDPRLLEKYFDLEPSNASHSNGGEDYEEDFEEEFEQETSGEDADIADLLEDKRSDQERTKLKFVPRFDNKDTKETAASEETPF